MERKYIIDLAISGVARSMLEASIVCAQLITI